MIFNPMSEHIEKCRAHLRNKIDSRERFQSQLDRARTREINQINRVKKFPRGAKNMRERDQRLDFSDWGFQRLSVVQLVQVTP